MSTRRRTFFDLNPKDPNISNRDIAEVLAKVGLERSKVESVCNISKAHKEENKTALEVMAALNKNIGQTIFKDAKPESAEEKPSSNTSLTSQG